MDEKQRLNAYIQLIQQLLDCDSGEEMDILRANPNLLDAGLVQVMRALAEKKPGFDVNLTSLVKLQLRNPVSDGNAEKLRDFAQKIETRGEIQQAIELYKERLKMARASGNYHEIGYALGDLGSAYRDLGQIQQAIELYKERLKMARASGNYQEIGYALGDLGSAYRDLGQIRRAIELYQERLTMARASGNYQEIGYALGNLSNAYYSLGQIEKALELYQERLTMVRASGNYQEIGYALGDLGSAYRDLGQIEKAIELYEERLTMARASGNYQEIGYALGDLGSAYRDLGQIEKAIEYYKQRLTIARKVGDQVEEGTTWENLGEAYKKLNQIPKALAAWREGLQVCSPAELPVEALRLARNLGDLGYDLQNWEIAIEGYHQAILAIEQSRYWATSEATKRELIANSLDIYQKMVQACINHQDYAQALLTVERSKSRTLLELLDSANLYPKNATDAQKQRISDLRRQIASYQQQLAYTSRDTLTPTTEKHPNQPSPETLIRQQLEAANQQFQDLLTELDDPNFTLTQQVPAQLPDLRRLLPTQTALIEWYLPREADSGFYAFLVTRRDKQIQITPHHFSAEDRQHLDQALQDYRSDYGKPSWNEQLPQRLETLSGALQLPRLLAELSEIQHLILIPHRELHLIPLHALPVSSSPLSRSGRGAGGEGKPLQDWFPVQYAPSCQILNNLQQRPPLEEPSTSFFALQNPTEDLTYADFEVEVLRRLFDPERVLSHNKATKTALEQPQNRAFLQQSRYIHFSCHGEFDEADPLNAYLRLANGEKLTFLDIFNDLNIPLCRLLVLSACKTGLVETPPTDDYVGLASAFFFAGTRTVVGSLWEAEEFSAALLMIRLYHELPRYSSVVMALRAAQDWLRTISRDGVLTWLRDKLKLEDSELKRCEKELKLFNKKCPFAPARYWAAFAVNGRLDSTGTSPQNHQ